MKWHFLDDRLLINNARTSAINESDATQRWMVIITLFISASDLRIQNETKDGSRALTMTQDISTEAAAAWSFGIIASTPSSPQTLDEMHFVPEFPIDCRGEWKFVQMLRNICLDIQSLFSFAMSCQHLTHFKYIFISWLATARQWTLIGKIMENSSRKMMIWSFLGSWDYWNEMWKKFWSFELNFCNFVTAFHQIWWFFSQISKKNISQFSLSLNHP